MRNRRWPAQACLLVLMALLPALSAQAQPLLSRLVLTSDRAASVPGGSAGVDDSAVPALTTPDGRALTASFLHRPIDADLTRAIQDGLRGYYNEIKRPFVEINIPAQDISGGILLVQVIETRIGAIRLEGNHWFSAGQYLGAIRAKPGDPIDTGRLFADTDWINGNPDRQVRLLIGQGSQPDTYDLTLHAQDEFPLHLTLAADNNGVNETGLYRVGLGLDWTNAFWRGDDLAYDFLTSLDGFRLRENILSYTATLPWRDTLTITGKLADTNELATANSLPGQGHDDILQLRYATVLPALAGWSHRVDIGYDFKSTNTNALTGGSQVFSTNSEIDQFVMDYSGQESDSAGATGLLVTLVGSPGNLSPGNTRPAFQSQQPGASPFYIYARVVADRLTTLPAGLSWNLRATGQYTSANLLESEQLIFGGADSVRGFVQEGALRDEGALMQNELRAPAFKTGLPDLLHHNEEPEGVVPFAFLDAGAGRNHLIVRGQPRSGVELVSIGPGITWQFSRSASFRFTWGFPLVRTGEVGSLLGPQFALLMNF